MGNGECRMRNVECGMGNAELLLASGFWQFYLKRLSVCQ